MWLARVFKDYCQVRKKGCCLCFHFGARKSQFESNSFQWWPWPPNVLLEHNGRDQCCQPQATHFLDLPTSGVVPASRGSVYNSAITSDKTKYAYTMLLSTRTRQSASSTYSVLLQRKTSMKTSSLASQRLLDSLTGSVPTSETECPRS